MDFMELIKKRHATKTFNGETISQEKIDALFEMIQFAPSSAGLQQFKVKVITDKEMKEKLLPHSYNQPQVTTCSHLLVFCAYTDFDARLAGYQDLMEQQGIPQKNIDGFKNMVSGFLAMKSSPDDALQWAARQTFLALDHAMLGAMSLGIDSCPMEGFNPAKYSEILNLPKELVPVVICPLGYASDAPRSKIRFPKEELFF